MEGKMKCFCCKNNCPPYLQESSECHLDIEGFGEICKVLQSLGCQPDSFITQVKIFPQYFCLCFSGFGFSDFWISPRRVKNYLFESVVEKRKCYRCTLMLLSLHCSRIVCVKYLQRL
jgi:hypothetical protein